MYNEGIILNAVAWASLTVGTGFVGIKTFQEMSLFCCVNFEFAVQADGDLLILARLWICMHFL